MRLAPLATGAAGLAAVIFAVGCGGGSGSATAGKSRPVTKAEFIREADRICRKADKVQGDEREPYIAAHKAEFEEMSPLAAQKRLVRVLELPTIAQQIKEIEALTSPEGEEKRVAGILARFSTALEKARMDPFSMESGNPARDPFTKINEAALAYGFWDCQNLG